MMGGGTSPPLAAHTSTTSNSEWQERILVF